MSIVFFQTSESFPNGESLQTFPRNLHLLLKPGTSLIAPRTASAEKNGVTTRRMQKRQRIASRISRPLLSNPQSTDELHADSCGRKDLRAAKSKPHPPTISPPRRSLNTTMGYSYIFGAMISPLLERVGIV